MVCTMASDKVGVHIHSYRVFQSEEPTSDRIREANNILMYNEMLI